MPWWIPTRTQCQTTAPGGPNGLALQTQTCTHMASTPHQECPARQQQRYQGHDNIFVKLAARSSAAQRPISLTFTGELSKDHLPGLHWGHAHKHGSSFIQVSSAHFAIIVDDDFEAWMPQAAAPGCSQVRKMLEGAPDTIIDLQLFFFKYAADPLNVNNANANLDDANFQIASKNSSNPYCCGRGQNGRSVFTNTLTRGLGGNLFLINGGYQPRISLQHNTWQRWRFLYSGAKGFTAITIVDAATGQVSPDCEMQLISKDGVFLPLLPRKVQGLVLAAANRVELLVRCNAYPGAKLVLSAGATCSGVCTCVFLPVYVCTHVLLHMLVLAVCQPNMLTYAEGSWIV
eukprot:GHRQ01016000.1.p1 GENE.GHRQ01016000.1~~GHRQ01016000.1.p1  ORF type:complete len:345 (+),score=71.99 GHRQ01016000.1:534-1568(+)